tara:strand:+ start:151 stop:546 length:396 start_codon:yes stop_codon:yes gene_type:complete
MNQLKKYILLAIGFIFYCLGIIGYILPGMPGTIFIILAALCFLTSYPKYYNKIINNKYYGDAVRDFIEFHIIPKRIKIIILSFIWVSSLTSIFYFLYYELLIYRLIVLILAFIGSMFIIKSKNQKPKHVNE